jgi:hypothetical protein
MKQMNFIIFSLSFLYELRKAAIVRDALTSSYSRRSVFEFNLSFYAFFIQI